MEKIMKLKCQKTRPLDRICPGFTMVELLVVIAVFTILLSAGIPMTLQGIQQRGVTNAANQLGEALQKAKLLAIKEQRNCTVTINSPNANQYTISISNEVFDLASYHGRVTFTDSPVASDAEITFTPQGLCNPAGAFLITSQVNPTVYRLRTTGAGGISRHQWVNAQWQ
jgi:prepilin-type N-terminal cleavage/methylation domain-containing protein